jgi:Ca-activated chloride channel family protein
LHDSVDCTTKRGKARRLAPAVVAALLAGPLALDARPQFTSRLDVVEVYATVTDEKGAAVTDLDRTAFSVREDDVVQEVSTFVAGDFPLSAALAIDCSFSMTEERLALAKQAARAFVNALRPEDQAMVIAIGSQVDVVAPLTADRAALFAAIQGLGRFGSTALHDATVESVDHVQQARGRRALVLLSDGVDRYSRRSAGEALEHVRRSDVLVYPIALGNDRPAFFAEVAVATGGASFHQRDPKRLTETLEGIARELRHQYLLGYTPSRPIVQGSPEWRTIDVTVGRSNLRVRARDGYLAR